jgi:superfamily II DNA/RNA helicase
LVLASKLAAYCDLREKRLNTLPAREKANAKIVFIGLQQRLLSSIKAFVRTLEAHRRALRRLAGDPEGQTASSAASVGFVRRDPDADADDLGQDDEKQAEEVDARGEEALAEAATVTGSAHATRQQLEVELAAVDEMLTYAKVHQDRPDSRVAWLVDWIRGNLLSGRSWNSRRLILFTEWEDTRRWVQTQLAQALADTECAEQRIAAFTGATSQHRREDIKQAFNRDPAAEPLRILICTDAAREGINLQMRCADLIHIDLPWNPSRIEQRNGRIDRKLQPEPEVRCRYFVYTQRPEDIVLKALVEKTTTIREQLGASGQVLEARIAERLERDGIETRNAKRQAELICNENDADRQRRATEDMDDETAARRKRIEKELAELRTDLDKSRKAVGIDSGELQHVTAIALSRFGVDLTQTKKVQGKNIATFTLDPDHEAFANDPSWALAFDDIRIRRRKKGEKRPRLAPRGAATRAGIRTPDQGGRHRPRRCSAAPPRASAGPPAAWTVPVLRIPIRAQPRHGNLEHIITAARDPARKNHTVRAGRRPTPWRDYPGDGNMERRRSRQEAIAAAAREGRGRHHAGAGGGPDVRQAADRLDREAPHRHRSTSRPSGQRSRLVLRRSRSARRPTWPRLEPRRRSRCEICWRLSASGLRRNAGRWMP